MQGGALSAEHSQNGGNVYDRTGNLLRYHVFCSLPRNEPRTTKIRT